MRHNLKFAILAVDCKGNWLVSPQNALTFFKNVYFLINYFYCY